MDDVEEIKKLKHRYFRALDSKDWDLYGACFAEDIVVDLRRAHGPVVEGRAAMQAYGASLTIVQSVHQGHNAEIDLTSATTATGVWALEDFNLWEDGRQNHGWGHYLETYEKKDGRWFIKTMALSYLRLETPTEKPALVAGKDGTAHLRGMKAAGLPA